MKYKQLIRKILTYCIFLIASVVMVGAFITATSYTQLALAILFYPLLVYLALKTFPRTTKIYNQSTIPVTATIQPSVKPAEIDLPDRQAGGRQAEPAKNENMIGITDIDKRVFLKLIGSVGFSLFLFSIFNKKAEGLFYGGAATKPGTVLLKDTAGNEINPATHQPTDGYRISEIDDNLVTFYGFTNRDGAWFIMKEDTDTGSFRYSRGESNYPGSWTNREKLKYDYFNNVF